MTTINIIGKSLGSRKPLFADFSIPVPGDFSNDGGTTLRNLLSQIVRHEVSAFHSRQEQRQFLQVLTKKQIESAAESGKIISGQSDVPLQIVDEEEAVAVACQAFEDGLYLVVLDDEEQTKLDQQVYLQPESRLTFIRLTMLAGG